MTSKVYKADYETFDTYEQGAAHSKFNWFRSGCGCKVLEDFDLTSTDVVDDGKAHVAQLNHW